MRVIIEIVGLKESWEVGVAAQVRRAVVGHLMLRLAGAWDDAPAPPPQQQQQQQQEEEAGGGCGSPGTAAAVAVPAAPGAGVSRASVTQTLHLLRRAMDPSCDLESLIMDCAVRNTSPYMAAGARKQQPFAALSSFASLRNIVEAYDSVSCLWSLVD